MDHFDSDAELQKILKLSEEANELTRVTLLGCESIDAELEKIAKLTSEFAFPFHMKLDDYDLDEFMEKVSPSRLLPAKYYKVPPYIHSIMMPIGSPVLKDNSLNSTDDSDEINDTLVEMPPLTNLPPSTSFSLNDLLPISNHHNKATNTIQAQSTQRKNRNYDDQRSLISIDSDDDISKTTNVHEVTMRSNETKNYSLQIDDWVDHVFMSELNEENVLPKFSNF